MLRIMFPPFTREMVNLLGDRWFGLGGCIFNNELYREVSVEIEHFDEYGNKLFFDSNGTQKLSKKYERYI